MALVAATIAAVVFRARQNQFVIGFGIQYAFVGIKKAGPACAAVVFVLRRKQWQVTGCTHIGALAFLVVQGAGERALGGLFEQHVVLVFLDDFQPFGFRFIQLVHAGN